MTQIAPTARPSFLKSTTNLAAPETNNTGIESGSLLTAQSSGGFHGEERSLSDLTRISAQPRIHQRAPKFKHTARFRMLCRSIWKNLCGLEMTEQLNLLLADTMTLRDLYKKSHWQVAGPTFYQLHLLFDKHFGEQVEIVDTIAERIQLLGGVSMAMAADIAETTRIERPPRGREEVPVQISRLSTRIRSSSATAVSWRDAPTEIGDDGTNDLVVSDVLRTNELQVWFLSEHLVDVPLVHAKDPGLRKVG